MLREIDEAYDTGSKYPGNTPLIFVNRTETHGDAALASVPGAIHHVALALTFVAATSPLVNGAKFSDNGALIFAARHPAFVVR